MSETWAQYLRRISGIDEGRSQREVAELTETDTGTLSRWLQGKNVPKPDGVIRVAHAFGRPAGEAMIAAGHFTPADLEGQVEVRGALDDLADEVLLAEVGRRMKR